MVSNSTPEPMQPKRVLFLASLPKIPDFQKYDADLMRCVQSLSRLGVTVCAEISALTLGHVSGYDVVVVLSHLDEESNELVLSDSRMDIAEFVNNIPDDFNGIVDFSSCYSAQWIDAIKAKCPDCHVLGAKGQTTLPFRLYIYPHVMQVFLENPSLEYKDAYLAVQDFVKRKMQEQVSDNGANDEEAATKLGKNMSSVYAPKQVERGKAFMVQLFLHDDSESSRKITIQAKKYDPGTNHVETQELSVKLKKGDCVDVGFSVFSAQPDCFAIDSPVKSVRWDGKMAKVQFSAMVSADFKADSFIGKLLLEVNHKPVGECSFQIEVAEENDAAPAAVLVEPRNMEEEGEAGRIHLKQQLKDNLGHLYSQRDELNDEMSIDSLNKAIETCKLCIDLLEKPIPVEEKAQPRKVFVSSTCEDFMQPFREAVRDVINNLQMIPEMCDDWPQAGCNPTHVCCRKVLDSDIYLGVFGGRYGYIEPSLESSMTQVEYMTALSAQKKILLFVINPLNKSDEPESIRKRQDDFISELKKTRILRTFKDVAELSQLINDDLLKYISYK